LPPWSTAFTQIQSSRQSADAAAQAISATAAATSLIMFVEAIRCP
jgi:hypothetical protein